MPVNFNANTAYKPVFRSSIPDGNPLLAEGIRQKTDEKWVGLPEMTKAILKGSIASALICGFIAFVDMMISGSSKVLTGKIKPNEILKPLKSMSKPGKIITLSVAAFIYAKNIIKAQIKINKEKSKN